MLNENIRALPCYKLFNQKIPGGVVSYLLFQYSGNKLADICTPNCSKERVCKYMLKDFIRGFIKSTQYSQQTADKNDVNFILAQNGFFYGKVPKNKKGDKKGSDMKINSMHNDEPSSDSDSRHFITLAYPKAWSAESLNKTEPLTEELKKN